VISQTIVKGAQSAGTIEGRDYAVELDRQAAIREVIGRARPGDVVLLAGKGHERRMLLADGPQAWSDEAEAIQALHDLGYA